MIPRLSSLDALRSFSPVTAYRSEQGPSESYQAGASSTPGIYQPRRDLLAAAPTPPAAHSLVRTALTVGLLGASALAAFPGQAVAAGQLEQTQEHRLTQNEVKAQGLQLLLHSRMAQGQGEVSVEQGMKQLNPRAAALLKTLPPEAQRVYVNLEPPAKQFLSERITGTTKVALGLITVNNREAFIEGQAYGRDVWDVAQRGITKKVANGAIPAAMEGSLRGLVDMLARMTPQQRETVIQTLQADVGDPS